MKPFSIECNEPEAGPPETVDVRIIGFLDAHTVVSFEKSMQDLIERDYNKIILDLNSLNYISSAGIGALMVLFQQLHRRQGQMVIVHPSAKVYKILDLLGFTKIFPIAQDRGEALKVIKPRNHV